MDALFCGNGTLLVQCAEVFRRAGGTVVGVLSGDAQILAWAAEGDIPCLGTQDQHDLGDLRFDYLFSVANLTVLPDALIARARKRAINFHDGPLPQRAGLNVPVWAILAGDQSHAVTWHEMTSRVDAGHTLKSRGFPIRETDTAFSLNASCYEAGLDSFHALVDELRSGRETPLAPAGERGWHGRADRPHALGTLDFRQTAAELDRLRRALDFGNYENPLALPKLWTGTRLLVVGGLEIVAGSGAAGLVRSIDATGIVVATGDGLVRLSGFGDLLGQPVAPEEAGIAVGQSLLIPAPLPACPQPLRAIGKDEAVWQQMLRVAEPALPPYQGG
ncbi:MAG: peptide synthetase, partial [Tabrizicola sp.]|nr:peptide synthetase [Tabrizicola sp.]